MKKLLPFLVAFIFCSTLKAQSPVLSFTNVTGTNSITCNTPALNYIASVSNYTSGPLTYTWVTASASASGTNVSLNTAGVYTLTAFDAPNSFSLSQTFTIIANNTGPSTTVNPTIQNIACASSSASATFTGIVTSNTTNVTQAWTSPYSSGAAISGGTISIYTAGGPGTYTYCVTNNINGCSTCKTVTVTSTSGYPTYSVTSATQFTLGCGSTSLTTISIGNVATHTSSTGPPTGGPVSYTVLTPGSPGTYTLGVTTGPAIYSVTTPGQYTVIVHDNTNACETIIPISIVSNTAGPQATASAINPILTCNVPNTLLQGASTNTNVSFSWTSTGPLQTSGDTLTVHSTAVVSNTFVGNYTLTVTDNNNQCVTTQTVDVFQNTNPPTAIITGSNSISCTTTITLTNASTSNVPPAFFPTLPVIGYAWYGPAPQPSITNTSNYSAYTPGTYTLIALDLNNGCKAITTKTLVGSGAYPQVSSPPTFSVNCPSAVIPIYAYVTGNVTGYTYSWTAPSGAVVSALNTPTITTNMAGNYNITVTSPAGCSTSTIITVANCAGLKQNTADKANIDIFPNPNNGVFTINYSDLKEKAMLEIYSALGTLVKKQIIISEKTAINMQNEGNGLYFITIYDGERVIKTAKIVKQ